MISIIETGALLNPDMTPMNAASATLVGLSTDTPKPTNAGNGWIFSEIDTGKIYIYDAENSTWREWSNGGGSGSGNFVIHLDMGTGSLDKTWQEIADAYSTGKTVVMINDMNEEGYRMITSAYVAAMTNSESASLNLIYVEVQNNQGVTTYQLSGMEFVADSPNDYPVMNMGG